MDAARSLVESLLSFAEMLLAIGLLAHGLPRRNPSARHVLLAVLGLLVMMAPILAIASILMPVPWMSWAYSDSASPSTTVVVAALFWACIPMGCVFIIAGLRRASVWTALFCAAAGYTVQNIASSTADFVELILGSGVLEAVPLAPTLAIELAVAAAVYALAWRLLIGPVRRHGLATSSGRGMLLLLGLVFLAVIMFDVANKQLVSLGAPLALVLLMKLIHGVVCVFVLAMSHELLVGEKLREESRETQAMLSAQRRQYELSRENVDAINIKCHDIKHQIRRLRGAGEGPATVDPAVLEDLERQVDVYDSLIRTGNDALDTILSEKGLICEREGIDFRCIADGTAVGFMAPVDVYALFGNALDNAIEASRLVADADGRGIALNVREAAGMASIHVENRVAPGREPALGEDGLPRTSKEDRANHGFGTRSMLLITRRYGGTMTMRVVDGVFHLNIALPAPE